MKGYVFRKGNRGVREDAEELLLVLGGQVIDRKATKVPHRLHARSMSAIVIGWLGPVSSWLTVLSDMALLLVRMGTRVPFARPGGRDR